jgi:hypothetical protein
MNIDLVYALLSRATWLFLGGWALALVTACVIEFRHDRS